MSLPEIRHITIIGAGTMGHSIGGEFALAGYDVVLYDLSESILQDAMAKVTRNLKEMAAWSLIDEHQIQPALDRIKVSVSIEGATRVADLVVEAVFENLEIKQDIFKQLDAVCPKHTILASNTSSLMPSSLASVTDRKDKVLVLHYFYPPHLMPLVEIVRSEFTSDETTDIVYQTALKAGKKPVIAKKEALGFIANRLQTALLHEALHIIDRGIATAEDIDNAVKYGFGRRLAFVGPVELAEVQDGWDQMGQIEGYILPDLDHSSEPSPLIRKKVERGEIGPKTGKGFYEWTPESEDAFVRNLYRSLADFVKRDKNH